MIITCENCGSKFRLDDGMISETGSKVRCSKCKHIFEVFPAPEEESNGTPVSPPADDDQDSAESSKGSDVLEEDVAAGDETLADMGGSAEEFDFDFLEEKGSEDDGSMEELLDFDPTDPESETETGKDADESSDDIGAPEPEGAEDSLGLELEVDRLDIGDDPVEGPGASGDETVRKESLDPGLEDVEAKEDVLAPDETDAPESEAEEDALELGLEGLDIGDDPVEGPGASEEDEAVPDESLDPGLEDVEAKEDVLAPDETDAPESEAEEDALELGLEGLDIGDDPVEGPGASGEDEAVPEENPDPGLEDVEAKEDALAPDETDAPESEAEEDALELGLEGLDIDEVSDEDVGETESDSDTQRSIASLDQEEVELGEVADDDFTLADIPEDEKDGDESGSVWGDEEGVGTPDSDVTEIDDAFVDEKDEEREDAPLGPDEEGVAVAPQGSTRSRPILLAFIILLSVVGGVWAAVTVFDPLKTSFKIPYLDIVIGDREAEPNDVGNVKIALLNVNESFENNEDAGQLFIIKGHVRNDYANDRSLIRIKGAIYDKNGNIVRSKTVYGGNVLTKMELEELSISALAEKLSEPSGMNESNVNVPPNKMIPFMVVFEDLPNDLGEFSVEVETSDQS